MRVLKFGGTSVADADRLRQVGSLVALAAVEDRPLVVVSALAGVTDALVGAVERAARGESTANTLVRPLAERHLTCLAELGGNGFLLPAREAIERCIAALGRTLGEVARTGACSPAARDEVLACGERLAVVLAAAALKARGLQALPVDAADLIVTDSGFGEAEVDPAATRARLAAWYSALPRHVIPVVTGFIGADGQGRTTTLGRGGSDYTASVIGAALGAERVEIWTDVDGVLSAPPGLVPEAATVPHLTFEEAAALAECGAKVLHHKTMSPVAEAGVPILVRNTLRPHGGSTRIDGRQTSDGRVKAVSGVAVSGIVVAVGGGIGDDPVAPWRLAAELGRSGVRVRSLLAPTSSVMAGVVVASDDVPRAVRALHDRLIAGVGEPPLALAGSLPAAWTLAIPSDSERQAVASSHA